MERSCRVLHADQFRRLAYWLERRQFGTVFPGDYYHLISGADAVIEFHVKENNWNLTDKKYTTAAKNTSALSLDLLMSALKGLLRDDEYTFTLESLALIGSFRRRMDEEDAEKEEEWTRTHPHAPPPPPRTPTILKNKENGARVSMSGGSGGGEKIQTCMLQFIGRKRAKSEEEEK